MNQPLGINELHALMVVLPRMFVIRFETRYDESRMSETFNHCLGLRYFSKSDIRYILDITQQIKLGLFAPNLNKAMVVSVFFEPSTRTRLSFEIAVNRCNGQPYTIDVSTSSLSKGESLVDMMNTIAVMGASALVVRHSDAGVPHFLHEQLRIPVINAGDGYHEHPTQGLLDVFTMEDHLGEMKNKRVLICGDIAHSRVAKSNIWALLALGANVIVCGPPNLLPTELADFGVECTHDIDSVIGTVDVVNMLRIQFERQSGIVMPSLAEYRSKYGLTLDRYHQLQPHAIVCHPGPINRGIELDSEVADGKQTVILDQVKNGVLLRMAVLHALLKGNQ